MKSSTISKIVCLAVFIISVNSCSNQHPENKTNKALSHQLVKKLTDVIVVDIFTPPVASRIYANCALAMYEAARFGDEKYPSITAKLNGFDPMPIPEKGKQYDFSIASIQAFCETAKKVTFSAPEITQFQDSMIKAHGAGLDEAVIQHSVAFGQQVADVVAKRLSKDNYKETRGFERFEVKTDDPSRWVPTLPDYADGLEPHWYKMMTMALSKYDEVTADPFPAYSTDTASAYFKELREVYDISKNRTEEQTDIAIFWDDNPFVSQHKGHVMFQDKKMTPPGHWMAITQKACRDHAADDIASAKAYAMIAVGMYDAFISCWYVKYNTTRIRPQTAIQRLLEEQWVSFIQTPPFPEYTSGHSTVSSSAAEILTSLFGDGQAFTDSSELEYNLPIRSFKSYRDAALEASVCRVYGGIHYRSGCENGNKQGKKVAAVVLNRITQ